MTRLASLFRVRADLARQLAECDAEIAAAFAEGEAANDTAPPKPKRPKRAAGLGPQIRVPDIAVNDVGADYSAGVARARLELATALVEAHQRGERSFTRAEVEGAERLLMAVAGGEWEQPASQQRRVAR